MKVKVVILIWVVFFLSPVLVFAQHDEKNSTIENLDHISDEALQMVKLQRYEDAKKILEYFSDQFSTVTVKEQSFSMDELRIVSVAHNEALEATTNVDLQHDERMNRVTKFRLVIDAITSSHQPLWTEMEGPMMTVFQSVKDAAYYGNNTNFHSNLNSFLSLYDMIYPSLKIDISKEQIQKLDTKVNYVDHYRPKVLSNVSNQQELDELGSQLQTIFDEMSEDEADPSLWWVIISTGSIIILTLSYVGWRKYQGDREQEKNRLKKLND
jgi:sporulation protein YpjB